MPVPARVLGLTAFVCAGVLCGRNAFSQSMSPIDVRPPSRFSRVAVPLGVSMIAGGAVLGLGGLLTTGIAFANSVGCWDHCWSPAVPYITISVSIVGAATLLAGTGVLIAGLVARGRESRVASAGWRTLSFVPVPVERGALLVGGLQF